MRTTPLTELAVTLLDAARVATSGRSAHLVYGGPAHVLSQTLLAVAADRRLDEHENPGEATVMVVTGRVRLEAGQETREGGAGDLLEIPQARHSLLAVEDSAVLLTVAKRR